MNTYESPFDILGQSKAKTFLMEAKAELMFAIEDKMKADGLTQRKVAELATVTQPRISSLINGEIDKFSLDGLIQIAISVGVNLELGVGDYE